MRARFTWLVLCLLTAVVVIGSGAITGCGGGTGGTTTTTTTTAGSTSGEPLTNIRVEAVFSGTSTQVDLGSLIAGDVVDLRMVGFDSSDVKHVVNGVTFTTNASSSVIQISGSHLTALASTGGTAFNIAASSALHSANHNVIVAPSGGAVISGRVRDTFGNGVFLVIVKFYQGTTLVGSTHTVGNGTYRIGVPVATNHFTIDLTDADPPATDGSTRYYRQFGFGDLEYKTADSTCLAATPTLVAGANTMGDIVPDIFTSGSPPPPPTGCFG